MKKILSLILCFLTIFFCAGCGEKEKQKEKNARENIKYHTGIEIPKEFEMLYYVSEGWQEFRVYGVFKVKDEPTEWLNENAFSNVKDEAFEKSFQEWFGNWRSCPVPEEYYPIFTGEYYWFQKVYKFLIYDPERELLIVYLFIW